MINRMTLLARPVIFALLQLSACTVGSLTPLEDEPEPLPPPNLPPLPDPVVYKRGSLAPIYELTPRSEYLRLSINGVPMKDQDFTTPGTVVSAAQKLQELGEQIATDRGQQQPLDLIRSSDDEQRAQQIPFRGNPADVELLTINGQVKAYVPLGGDLMTPGNEVAAVTLNGAVSRIQVGIRPQQVVVHPAGLVLVCNQFSNYISIIDASTDQLLQGNNGPVEIPTEFYCADLLLVGATPDADEQELYVANSWRGSVLRYSIQLVRESPGGRVIGIDVQRPAADGPANRSATEIAGVGANPFRLALSEDRSHLYVANSRGGELSRIRLIDNQVTARIEMNAPTIDVVQIQDIVLVPTTMPDRGLLDVNEPLQTNDVLAPPVLVTGLDGIPHEAHPGALFDRTRSYNFEDVRNGLFEIEPLLQGQSSYYTDDVSSEPNFLAAQKVLSGALPQAIIRNAAGNRIYLAHSGSDQVQELEVRADRPRVRAVPGGVFQTAERPFAMTLDEQRRRLYVVSWGGEVLEVFDLDTRARISSTNLGYAEPAYPATNMERGEYFFYNADWSNNTRKSCASCHLDELLADGIGFANGATAPTSYHQVRPNFNQATTDAYFWNGTMPEGNYSSLASAAQTRTNCELVLFGLIEGPGSNPATRVGDPNNRVTSGGNRDQLCRPVITQPGQPIPDNFNAIQAIIVEQKLVRDELIEQVTGIPRIEVSRFTDFYTLSELRLPPNPLKYLYVSQSLSDTDTAKLERGRQLFAAAGCSFCHNPNNTRHPFADGKNHGGGADWVQRFINTYADDPRITDALGGIPRQMSSTESLSTPAVPDKEINIHVDPIDYFRPFCFTSNTCLTFDDPLAENGGNTALESERLDLLIKFNLGDPERGFVPGNVRGQPRVNTPAIRGIWWQSNMLHHGLAHSLAEAILAPGHPALLSGEKGFAVNALGEFNVHGQTSTLTAEDMDAIQLYVESIE